MPGREGLTFGVRCSEMWMGFCIHPLLHGSHILDVVFILAVRAAVILLPSLSTIATPLILLSLSGRCYRTGSQLAFWWARHCG